MIRIVWDQPDAEVTGVTLSVRCKKCGHTWGVRCGPEGKVPPVRSVCLLCAQATVREMEAEGIVRGTHS